MIRRNKKTPYPFSLVVETNIGNDHTGSLLIATLKTKEHFISNPAITRKRNEAPNLS